MLWNFASSRNIKNAKPLWLVCDFMSLSFDGNGLSKFSCLIIHGPHSLTLLDVALLWHVINVSSPMPSLDALELGGTYRVLSFSLIAFSCNVF
jgi:hypothetical protein